MTYSNAGIFLPQIEEWNVHCFLGGRREAMCFSMLARGPLMETFAEMVALPLTISQPTDVGTSKALFYAPWEVRDWPL